MFQQDPFIAVHQENKAKCHLGKEKSSRKRTEPNRKLLSSACLNIKESKKNYKKKRKRLKNKGRN